MRPSKILNPATLIVGPSWVGDMVMAQALFKFLKAERPARPLDVLAPAWSLPIVERMPEVRRGIAAETGHGEVGFVKRRRIARSLKDEAYEQAIVLPRSFKSALIPWLARIPRRTGYRGESRFGLINDVRTFDPRLLDQTVKRFLALGIGEGGSLPTVPYPSLSIDADRQRRLQRDLALASGRPIVAMMPGAEYGPAKCWPLEHFATLARRLVGEGYDVWILGSEKDRAAGAAVAGTAGVTDLCGRTSLADVIDLLACAEQAVSNDSGLMHIAAAVGIHVHAIYGSSSPHFTPPLTDRCDVHYLDLECSPCFERDCPLRHFRCLKDLAPELVLDSIRSAAGDAGTTIA